MNNPIPFCIVVGLSWAAAPLLGRLSSVSAMMMTVLIAAGSCVAVLPIAVSQNYGTASAKSLMFGLLAGIVNGIGLIAFYRLVAGSNEKAWELSRAVPICFVIVPLCVVVGARVFFNEPIGPEKIIGLGFACVAIWFLA